MLIERLGCVSRAVSVQQLYERILKNAGFPYFVNGIGGRGFNSFIATPEPGMYAGMDFVSGQHICWHTRCVCHVHICRPKASHHLW